MKSILFFRHGKASHNYEQYASDFDRDLAERGRKDAKESVLRIIKNNLQPQIILSSPSVRTLQTLKIINNELNIKKEKILLGSNLYLASVPQIFRELSELDNQYNSLLLVGHNPAFTEMVNLCEGTYLDNLPTAGVACLAFNKNTWENLNTVIPKLTYIDYPSKNRQ